MQWKLKHMRRGSVYASIVDVGLHKSWLVHGQRQDNFTHIPPLYAAIGIVIDCDSWYLKTRPKIQFLSGLKMFQRRDCNGDGIGSRVIKEEDTECDRQSFPAPSSCGNQTVL